MVASSLISVMTSTVDAFIDIGGLIDSASSLVSLLLFTAFTTVLYRLLTTPRLPLRAATVGGVVAAVLFLIAGIRHELVLFAIVWTTLALTGRAMVRL